MLGRSALTSLCLGNTRRVHFEAHLGRGSILALPTVIFLLISITKEWEPRCNPSCNPSRSLCLPR